MPAPARGHQRERIVARLSSEQKVLIERAAQLRGCNLSQYLVGSALDAAARDIRDHETITLSARDSLRFIEALLKPQPANQALEAAARDYQTRWR